MITKTSKTEIQLKKIQLISSLFEWPSDLENPALEDLNLSLEVSYDVKANFLDVYINVCFGNESKNTDDDFYLEVEMLGVFEKVGIPQQSDEEFAKEKAAAIIFPYIRQHIRAISLDAGFTPITLPAVNFQTCFKDTQKEDY